jgi:N-acyl homoserine lactone hydrolase
MPVGTVPKPAVLPLRGGQVDAAVRVHPILTCEVHAPPAHTDRPSGRLAGTRIAAQLLGSRENWNWLPVPAFLVEHPQAGAVLIDTGFHPTCATDAGANLGSAGKLLYRIRMEPDQALRTQLPARGVELRDARVVVMTHLHFDHASAVSEFPGATFVVDRREWEAASRGGLRRGYHPQQFDYAFDWRMLDFEDGNVRSFSGFARSLDLFGDGSVRIVSTRGHTLGHQSVLLRTQRREVLVLGDAAHTQAELRGRTKPLVVHDEHLRRRCCARSRVTANRRRTRS